MTESEHRLAAEPPATFTVRIAEPDDHKAVSRLFDASYRQLMRPAYDRESLAAALPLMTRANPMLLATGTFFLAEMPDREVVGCGGWTRERPGKGDKSPGLGHIRHFGTHPEHTGLGVGRALYEACERQARHAGMDRFECYASLNAEGFYAALGFRRIERVEIAVGNVRLPSVWMTRSLLAGKGRREKL